MEHPVARQLIVFLSHISQINLVRVIGGADHAEEEALRQGEHAQEDKVVRRLTSSSIFILRLENLLSSICMNRHTYGSFHIHTVSTKQLHQNLLIFCILHIVRGI